MSWRCVCASCNLYTNCASGLVGDSGDNKAEMTPEKHPFGVESGSSEKQPQHVDRESNISMFKSLGDDAI